MFIHGLRIFTEKKDMEKNSYIFFVYAVLGFDFSTFANFLLKQACPVIIPKTGIWHM